MSTDNNASDKNSRFSILEMPSALPLVHRDSEPRSLACIIDELYLSLMGVKEHFCMINTNRKQNILDSEEEDDRCNIKIGLSRRVYEEQARYKMYRIPVYRPPPIFVIQLKHLDRRLKVELSDLGKENKDLVVREAVERIYEEVDRRFFLLSVRDSALLQWRLEK